MPKVIQNKFDGGHAEDIRTFAIDECEKSLNFDIFTNPHKLLPYRDTITETVSSGTITDFQLNGVVLIGSIYWTIGFQSSVSSRPSFWSKANITDNWQLQATGAAGLTLIQGTIVSYKGVAYCVAYNASLQIVLVNSAGTTVGTSGTATQTTNTSVFVHPEDNVLYIVQGKVISKWDGSTFTESATILPTDAVCNSITNYGSYLAIACVTSGKSVVYLWARDMTVNTLQETIPFGDGTLSIITNLGNELVGIVNSNGSFAINAISSIDVKVYSGGTVNLVKSLTMSTAIVNAGIYKTKYNEKLYFGYGTDTNIYAVGKNKGGRWTITKDRTTFNGTTTGSGTPILTIINGILWVSFNTNSVSGNFYRNWISSESNTFNTTSTHKTSINPSMPIADRTKRKQLKSFKVYYTGKASGTVAVKYLVDGVNSSAAATFESIISENTSNTEAYKNATLLADSQAFAAGIEYQFQLESTGGVEIKSYEYEYDILND